MLSLALEAFLLFVQPINWDEFRFLSDVHLLARGELTESLQTFHPQIFWWLSNSRATRRPDHHRATRHVRAAHRDGGAHLRLRSLSRWTSGEPVRRCLLPDLLVRDEARDQLSLRPTQRVPAHVGSGPVNTRTVTSNSFRERGLPCSRCWLGDYQVDLLCPYARRGRLVRFKGPALDVRPRPSWWLRVALVPRSLRCSTSCIKGKRSRQPSTPPRLCGGSVGSHSVSFRLTARRCSRRFAP